MKPDILDLLKRLEWAGSPAEYLCPGCGNERPGHRGDCQLKAAIEYYEAQNRGQEKP